MKGPLLIEQFLDDEEIYQYFLKFLDMTENMIPELEHCIALESSNESAKKAKLVKSAISSIHDMMEGNKRILLGLANRKFLASGQVEEYYQRLENIKNNARQITIRENLPK